MRCDGISVERAQASRLLFGIKNHSLDVSGEDGEVVDFCLHDGHLQLEDAPDRKYLMSCIILFLRELSFVDGLFYVNTA